VELLNQAVSLLKAGDAAAARALLRSVPTESDARSFLLGATAHALQDIPGAITDFTAALRRNPAHAQAACALASLYAGLGRLAEAEALLRQTLARVEDDQLRFNLAVVMEDTGKVAAALAQYATILAHTPGHYAARHNRAGLLAREQRLTEAAAEYRILVREHPQQTLPWHNLGELELTLGHYEAAITLLDTVLQREPDNGKALLSLAVAFAANGDITESQARFDALRRQDPERWESARLRLNGQRGQDGGIDARLIFLIHQESHLQACNWRHWPRYGEIFRDFIRQPGDGDLLPIGYASMLAPLDYPEQLALDRHIAAQVRRATPEFTHAPSPAPARLRVGYAAPRLGLHVTGQLFRELFSSHDPDAVEVLILSLGKDDGSPELARLRATHGPRWHDLSGLDNHAAAAHIRDLGLDILVDLAVYNDDARPEIFAARPAPVQVAWQGGAYSSGAPWMDYVIADAVVRPGDGWCSEAEVLLPGCYFLNGCDGPPPAVPTRESLGLPADKFVFACLNTPSKIEPDIFDCWMRILAQCPDSVLWLLSNGSAPLILNLKREAEWRGIDPRRLIFANRVTPAAHVARQGAADLFLDTAQFNGHTTIAESLWAGTPALTCPGRTFASRVGASIVQSAGLPELVVETREAYEAMALALYRDRERLQALRQRLAGSRLLAPTFNVREQAAHMEKAYRHMRERFAAGLPPAPFAVADLPG
jgi:predicted O-linked N-acetylglucosamine transferase (SPINDLY family)